MRVLHANVILVRETRTKAGENDKQHVFALLDAFIKQTKLQSIM